MVWYNELKMHALTQSCVLVLWYCSFTFVRGQDCIRQGIFRFITDENLDKSKLLESYTVGQTVSLPCTMGHTGFFRARCEDTGWQVLGRPMKCELKSCGHPGEAPFADFDLVEGDDFVFGAQVKYKCNKGYRMISMEAYRTCYSNGWVGLIPVCEAFKCPVVQAEKGLLVIGNVDEATFGNVLQFECPSDDFMLVGKSEIYCTEEGQWSDRVPKCIEIQCNPPNIENGHVTNRKTVYTKGQTLTFNCEPKYKRVSSRTPQCVKRAKAAEWSPSPACEPIKCILSQGNLQGTIFTPVGKNIYFPGESVTVTCGSQYWTHTTRKESAVIICKDTGDWETLPVCEEIFCRRPAAGPFTPSPYYWPHSKLQTTQQYTCAYGFRKTNGANRATCTKKGWTPDPLCEEITCQPEDIENVVQLEQRDKYGYKESITYRCANGYEPVRFDSMTAVCESTGWSKKPTCEVIQGNCKLPTLNNGFVVQEVKSYLIVKGGTAYYSCNNGYKPFTQSWWGEIQCKNNQLSVLPKCIDNTHCGKLPTISHAHVEANDNSYENSGSAFITCDPGYVAQGGFITCHNGEWTVPSGALCIASGQCNAPPRVSNAILKVPFKKRYDNGTQIAYECRHLYGMKHTNETSAIVQCTDGEWNITDANHLDCTKMCADPKNIEHNIQLISNTEPTLYFHGDQIEYKCNKHLTQPNRKAVCDIGTWKEPVACNAPPPSFRDEDE